MKWWKKSKVMDRAGSGCNFPENPILGVVLSSIYYLLLSRLILIKGLPTSVTNLYLTPFRTYARLPSIPSISFRIIHSISLNFIPFLNCINPIRYFLPPLCMNH